MAAWMPAVTVIVSPAAAAGIAAAEPAAKRATATAAAAPACLAVVIGHRPRGCQPATACSRPGVGATTRRSAPSARMTWTYRWPAGTSAPAPVKAIHPPRGDQAAPNSAASEWVRLAAPEPSALITHTSSSAP